MVSFSKLSLDGVRTKIARGVKKGARGVRFCENWVLFFNPSTVLPYSLKFKMPFLRKSLVEGAFISYDESYWGELNLIPGSHSAIRWKTLGRKGSGYELRECPFRKKAVSFLEALCSWPTELENSLSYFWTNHMGKVVSVDTGSEKHEFCFRRKQACTQKARVKSRTYENWLKNPIGKPLQVMVSWESGLP